jgi:hypothetical protein
LEAAVSLTDDERLQDSVFLDARSQLAESFRIELLPGLERITSDSRNRDFAELGRDGSFDFLSSRGAPPE